LEKTKDLNKSYVLLTITKNEVEKVENEKTVTVKEYSNYMAGLKIVEPDFLLVVKPDFIGGMFKKGRML